MKNESTDHKPLRDLASQVALNSAKLRERVEYGGESNWQTPPCFWEGVVQNDIQIGVADWTTEFNLDTTTATITFRRRTRKSTAGGELHLAHPNGSNTYGARLYSLIVYTEQPQTITCHYGLVGSSSAVQIKVNGFITQTSGSTDASIDIELIPGYNFIYISLNEQTDGFVFEGLLFDGDLVQWVHPNAARNPVRQGYVESGSSGSGNSNTGGGLVLPEGS
jgi:hypothetical protein